MDDELEDAFINYINAKDDVLSKELILKDREDKLIKLMEERQEKTVQHSWQEFRFSATYTQRTTTQINEKGLRKALTARVFDKYTVKKLDRKALEEAMSSGVIDPRTVAQYVDEVPGKTFLTYRVKEEHSEEPEGS